MVRTRTHDVFLTFYPTIAQRMVTPYTFDSKLISTRHLLSLVTARTLAVVRRIVNAWLVYGAVL